MSDLKKPIAHEDAEKAVVGAMIHYGGTRVTLAKGYGVNSDMFSTTSCRILFEALCALGERLEPFDHVAILTELKKGNRLEAIGGPECIFSISSVVRDGGANFESHCRDVREYHVKRGLARLGSQVASEAHDGESAQELLSKLKSVSESLTGHLMADSDLISGKKAAKLFLDELKERMESSEAPGQLTGIPQIDEIGGGMREGELWVISGPTSGGKSVLSLQMAQEAIKSKGHVLIFTLEMTASEVVARLVSNLGRLRMEAITSGERATKEETKKMKRGLDYIGETNLSIADKSGMTSDWICAQAERYAERHDVDMVIIDYLQLVEGRSQKGQSREQEISKISRQFKQLAKKLRAPVIAPSQLNDDGKLRESRAIGHDANVVLKIEEKGIYVSKNRNGERGQTLPLILNGEMQRFEPSRF